MATSFAAGGGGSGGSGDYITAINSSSLSWSTVSSATISPSAVTGAAGTFTVTQTDSTQPITIGNSYNSTYGTSAPINISSGGYVYVTEAEKDEIKSKPAPAGVHEHEIQCRLRVESTKVISEYFCNHCQTVLHSKVISKIPKSIIKKQCLSRIVKGV